MNSLLLLMFLNFTHAYDIEIPSSGFTLSFLELSYGGKNVIVRTSPMVLPFMLPLTLRLSSKNSFLRLSFAPFYGGYFIKSSYPEIEKFSASPMFSTGFGMWVKKGNIHVVPDFSIAIQKNTIYTGKLSIKHNNLIISGSIGNKKSSGIEGMYILQTGKLFIIMGLRYPGIRDMGLWLPLVPLFNMGFTF